MGLFANPRNLLQRGIENPIAGLLYSGSVEQLISQIVGIAAVGVFTVVFSLAAWLLIQLVFGLRVPLKAELAGLDISEHGMEAYNGFVAETDLTGSNTHPDDI